MKNLYLISILTILSCGKETSNIENNIENNIEENNRFELIIESSTGGNVDTEGGFFENGESVTITATPENDYIFEGWSDGSIQNPLTIIVSENLSLTANFAIDCETRKIDPIEYNDISYKTGLFFQLDSNIVDDILDDNCHQSYLVEHIIFDYNFDGFLDLIYAPNDYQSRDNRQLIQFYTGDCERNFNPDELNNNKFLGLVHLRKILLGDYNLDGFVDVLFIGHGWDRDDYPGEYPVILFGSQEGRFSENRLIDFVGYNHGGSSGDFDNDGDLDIILNTTRLGDKQFTYLVNDGSGNFSSSNNIGVFTDPFLGAYVNSELYDINKDGNLDLFLMNEIEMDDMDEVIGRDYYSELVLGNGNDFNGKRINIPRVYEGTSVSPYYTVYDIEFFDLDSDGIDELIINRTTENYIGWYIQIVKFTNDNFIDVTDTFINENENEIEDLITYLEIREINEEIILRTSRSKNCNSNDSFNYYEWKLIGNTLIRQ